MRMLPPAKSNPKDKKQVGFVGFRWLILNGKPERRKVYAFGDTAFVVSDQNKNPNKVVAFPSHLLFKTEAEAAGGEDVDAFVSKYDGKYQKAKVRFVRGRYFRVNELGELRGIEGTVHLTELEAAEKKFNLAKEEYDDYTSRYKKCVKEYKEAEKELAKVRKGLKGKSARKKA